VQQHSLLAKTARAKYSQSGQGLFEEGTGVKVDAGVGVGLSLKTGDIPSGQASARAGIKARRMTKAAFLI
jgi:hypothetical protein